MSEDGKIIPIREGINVGSPEPVISPRAQERLTGLDRLADAFCYVYLSDFTVEQQRLFRNQFFSPQFGVELLDDDTHIESQLIDERIEQHLPFVEAVEAFQQQVIPERGLVLSLSSEEFKLFDSLIPSVRKVSQGGTIELFASEPEYRRLFREEISEIRDKVKNTNRDIKIMNLKVRIEMAQIALNTGKLDPEFAQQVEEDVNRFRQELSELEESEV